MRGSPKLIKDFLLILVGEVAMLLMASQLSSQLGKMQAVMIYFIWGMIGLTVMACILSIVSVTLRKSVDDISIKVVLAHFPLKGNNLDEFDKRFVRQFLNSYLPNNELEADALNAMRKHLEEDRLSMQEIEHINAYMFKTLTPVALYKITELAIAHYENGKSDWYDWSHVCDSLLRQCCEYFPNQVTNSNSNYPATAYQSFGAYAVGIWYQAGMLSIISRHEGSKKVAIITSYMADGSQNATIGHIGIRREKASEIIHSVYASIGAARGECH